MKTYAGAKGKTAAPVVASTGKQAVAELSPEQLARVAENRAFVLEHMPELAQIVKDLHANGLIVGWRSVVRCSLLDASNNE